MYENQQITMGGTLESPISQASKPKKRIEYIDAMRGFTMLLVVYSHVEIHGHINLGDLVFSYGTLLSEFRMPLFFFISGFVLYKPNAVWNWTNTLKFLHKKIYVQILSPTIFLALFCYCFNRDFLHHLFFDIYRGGYWFTFTLFEFYVIYIILQKILCFIHNDVVRDIILILVGFGFLGVCHNTIFTSLHIPASIQTIFGLFQCRLIIFFLIGNLVHKHFSIFEKLLDTTPIIALSILLFIVSNIIIDCYNSGVIIVTIGFLASISGVVITFSFFRKRQQLFTKETKLGQVFQYVGRRTLDIYLIHYFFVMTGYAIIPNFSQYTQAPIAQFVVALFIAIIIVSMSLAVSSILRLSPFIAKYFFGAKA